MVQHSRQSSRPVIVFQSDLLSRVVVRGQKERKNPVHDSELLERKVRSSSSKFEYYYTQTSG